jgi:hypothetical protein
MRVMTQARRHGVALANDLPNCDGHSGKFMLRLLAAWIAMGFRRPEITLGKTVRKSHWPLAVGAASGRYVGEGVGAFVRANVRAQPHRARTFDDLAAVRREISVRDRGRLADKDAVAFAADFERTCLVRRRENHSLARRKNGHDADRRPGLALRKGRDNMEPIALNGVVGDAGNIAEVDAFGLDRPQAVGVSGPERGQGECGGEKGAAE